MAFEEVKKKGVMGKLPTLPLYHVKCNIRHQNVDRFSVKEFV